jgi:hypothetical protein
VDGPDLTLGISLDTRKDAPSYMHKSDADTSPQSGPIARIEKICGNLFRADFVLHINMEARILILLREQSPSLLTQQLFTKNEWNVLMVLLRNYPHYAPHEVLLSSITSLSVDECRQKLQETRLLGADMVRRELKPVYRALCSIRGKLTKLHPDLKVALIRDAGYLLMMSDTDSL